MDSLANHVLVNILPVLDNVFKYMSAKTLCSISQVCKVWQKSAQRELKRRPWCSAGVLTYEKDPDVNWLKQPSQLSQLFFDSLSIKPSLVFQLTSSETEYTKDEPYNWDLEKYTPTNCVLVSSDVGGVIGKPINSKKLPENKEFEYKNAISVLCLRPYPGIDFNKFFISRKKLRFGNGKNLLDFIDNSRPVTNSVILLFATSYTKTRSMVERMREKAAGRRLIVIGGYTDSIRDSTGDNESKGIAGIKINGDSLCASLFVHSDHSLEKLEAGLIKMKHDILKKVDRKVNWNKSIMFSVMCVERGVDFYKGKSNIESNIVGKVFPGISMFGFFGYGEIGFDSENTSACKHSNFELTSIFCLLNYG